VAVPVVREAVVVAGAEVVAEAALAVAPAEDEAVVAVILALVS
jgi:hypothetical protein